MSKHVEFLREEADVADRDGVPETGEQFRAAADEIERLNSWEGLLSILDRHYPADVPLVSDPASGPGPHLVWALREIERLLRHITSARDLLATHPMPSDAYRVLSEAVNAEGGEDVR